MRLLHVLFMFICVVQVTREEEVVRPVEVISLINIVSGYLSRVWEQGFLLPPDIESIPEWSFLTGGYNLSMNVADSTAAIMEQYKRITDRIDRIAQNIKYLARDVRMMQRLLPEEVEGEISLDELLQHIQAVEAFYGRMEQYYSRLDQIEELTLVDFAKSIVSHHPESVRVQLEQLHAFLLPLVEGDIGVLKHLSEQLKMDDNRCQMPSSPEQHLYAITKAILLTQLKGYTLMQFSWLLLRSFGKGNFQSEASMAEAEFLTRILEEIQMGEEAIRNVSIEFRRCDPSQFLEGENFIALKRLLQGYLENEVDMNDYSSCMRNCDSYKLQQQQRCYKGRKYQLCKNQEPCRGDIRKCEYYETDMDVCLSSKPDRRYGWIQMIQSKRVLGDTNESCSKEVKVEGWWRFIVHCSYCFCICDDKDGDTDRYFDLRPVEADVSDNRIVTGLKLEKTNRIVHIKIQTGRAFPSGEVNQTSIQWENVEALDLKDNITEGEDYFKMTWDERAIDLDDLRVPRGRAITGVRFRVVGGHVGLMIKVSSVDFQTGIVDSTRPSWISNDETPISDHPRTAIPLDVVDIPTRSELSSQPMSTHNQYLHFTHSSIHKDVAQSTVPYFDSQPVAPNPSVWLTGAGLYYKSSPGYGGFIGLRVFTFPVHDHLAIKV